jgi:hypothetical protein
MDLDFVEFEEFWAIITKDSILDVESIKIKSLGFESYMHGISNGYLKGLLDKNKTESA